MALHSHPWRGRYQPTSDVTPLPLPRIPLSDVCPTLPPPPLFKGAHLPAEVAVVHVSDVEGLGGEGVRLHVYLGPSDLRDFASGGGVDVQRLGLVTTTRRS